MAYLIRDYHKGKPVLKLASTKGKGKERHDEEKALQKKDLVGELRQMLNSVKDRVLEKAMDYAELLPLASANTKKGRRLQKSPGVFVDNKNNEQEEQTEKKEEMGKRGGDQAKEASGGRGEAGGAKGKQTEGMGDRQTA
jgi:hypothetical protein